MSHRVQRALAIAEAAHAGQSYGDRPYMDHVRTVAGFCVRWGEDAQVIALLHDVVEDTAVTLDNVGAVFGRHVEECVALVSDPPAGTRAERKAAMCARLAAAGEAHHDALVVKVADRLANVAACHASEEAALVAALNADPREPPKVNPDLARSRNKLARYRQEHPAFRRAAYRPGLCDDLWEQLDALIGTYAWPLEA